MATESDKTTQPECFGDERDFDEHDLDTSYCDGCEQYGICLCDEDDEL